MSAGKRKAPHSGDKRSKPSAWLHLLVCASGFAALVYQVLWMRQMGLLFGSTSQAAAATWSAFFLGLAAGSWWWGRKLADDDRPLRAFARLEGGIVLCGILYFAALQLIDWAYPAVHVHLAGSPWLLAARFAMALLLVFPASFCMGGTLPAIAAVAGGVGDRDHIGRRVALLYATNTLGATLGVWFAAFVAIPSLGCHISYVLALAVSLAVAVYAWRRSGDGSSVAPANSKPQAEVKTVPPIGRLERFSIGWLAFVSGLVVLGMEVVWMRVFAQVHENSVYSFAIILIVVLACLTIGAGISSLLARLTQHPMRVLGMLIVVAGTLMVFGPRILLHVTDGLKPVSSIEPWDGYVRGVIRMGIGGVGYAALALGTIFPLLLKSLESAGAAPARWTGRLLAINTAGAILGSLAVGFLLLPHLGMWRTMQVLASVHLLAGIFLPMGGTRVAWLLRTGMIGLLAVMWTWLDSPHLPVTGRPAGLADARILKVWEESDCTVAVMERPDGHRSITVNSGYSLGSTKAWMEQANQGRIPLHLFPQTRSICFIGLGTGISAAAALDKRFDKVERVVSCELSKAVVEASRDFIPEPLRKGLFSDPRSTILVEDGRLHLMATKERYDMINADLFLPYQKGAGSLYSREHFRNVARCLNPDGVFVQWLPLYQLTEREFGVITRTMLEVFPEVTLWRNNFVPGHEKVALIGRLHGGAFAQSTGGFREEMLRAVEGLEWRQTSPDMVRVGAASIPFFYAGNPGAARAIFEKYPVNTEVRPVIEYETPKTFREVAVKDRVIWCVGPKFAAWVDRLFAEVPLGEDPVWQGHPEASWELARAGMAFQKAMLGKALGNSMMVEEQWQDFLRHWQAGAR